MRAWKRGGILSTALRETTEAVFPSGIYCISCGSLIDRSRMYSLCDACIRKFHWITGRTCQRCGKAMPETSRGSLCYDCMDGDHYFAKGFSALTYGLYERELMMRLKYSNEGYLARICGDILFDRIEQEILEGYFSQDHHPIHVIAPVPVGLGRLRRRGYNQSDVMARQLARRWRKQARSSLTCEGSAAGREANRARGMDAAGRGTNRARGMDAAGRGTNQNCDVPNYDPNLLRRSRETGMLRSLNPAERRLALRGAFEVRPGARGRLTGKRVLLVDDIYTTGATADACSRALLEGGAAEVCLLTLCSGGNRRPKDE